MTKPDKDDVLPEAGKQVLPEAGKQVLPEAGKQNSPSRPQARLPKGLRDVEAAELRETWAMIEKIRAVYERYGFEPLETPAFEYTDALGKFLPDQDRPNEGVFSFQRRGRGVAELCATI